MDPVRFDTLIKTLSSTGTRRGLLRLLAAVPVAGGLLALGNPASVARKGDKGRQRGKDGKHGKSRSRDGKAGRSRDGKAGTICRSESKAKACAGKCGTVRNNCGKRVECGACTCATGCHPVCQTCTAGSCQAINEGGACGTCQVCNATGACVPDEPGTACGEPANNQICLDSGDCGVITCSDSVACPSGCICSGPTSPSRCYDPASYCALTNQLCGSAPCPQGFQCLPCFEGGDIVFRCNPLCTG
jgi:hypothetical protein